MIRFRPLAEIAVHKNGNRGSWRSAQRSRASIAGLLPAMDLWTAKRIHFYGKGVTRQLKPNRMLSPEIARSLSENSKGSRAWGLRGERKARGGGDVHAHRRRRATQRSSCNPHAPFGFRLGRGICFVGAPRRCAPTSPASRRLASAPSKPGTRPLPILGQAPSVRAGLISLAVIINALANDRV